MKVKIKDYEYEILEVDEYDDGLLKDGQYYPATHSFRQAKIWIVNNVKEKIKRGLLKHELNHAFIACYGFGQVNWNEEVVCDYNEIYSEDILKITDEYFKKGE